MYLARNDQAKRAWADWIIAGHSLVTGGSSDNHTCTKPVPRCHFMNNPASLSSANNLIALILNTVIRSIPGSWD